MYTTRVLADYVSTLRGEDLSSETRDAALRCVLDLLTAAAAGYQEPSVEGVRRVAASLFGDGGTAIWFAGRSVTAAGAVFCNSAAASALDLDDGNRMARGHPGAAVIPAAIAAAAEVGATVEDFLAAIVAGYEVGVRVASTRNPANTSSRQSGRWTGYAAVAAAGRLRGTAPAQLSHAFAIAGVTAPNQEANGSSGYSRLTGNDVKEGIPWSAVTGITALHLAETGHIGPEDILDHASHFSSERIIDGLGRRPEILSTYFKPYSCCRYNHPAIDAFNGLMASHPHSPNDIISVDVHTFGWALKLGNRVEPANLIDVQYSIPYCIGLAATMGSAAMLPIGNDVLNRPDASEFARKVALHVDPDLDARFPGETLARVFVTTAAGKFESPVTIPRGEPANPMSWRDLQEKFCTATRNVLNPRQQQDFLQAVDRLGEGDLAPLIRVLGRAITV